MEKLPQRLTTIAACVLSAMDDPYQHLVEIAKHLESFDSRQEITSALDELEFIYEVLAPEQQELASQLLERLSGRLISLDASENDDA